MSFFLTTNQNELNMPAYLSMIFSVLIWSLYPLAAAIGLGVMSAEQLVLSVLVISALGSGVLAFVYLGYKGLIGKAVEIQKSLPPRAYAIILMSGVAGILCHSFFYWALSLSNKAGVSLLFESWPIIAVIATPFLMKKKWKNTSFKEFAACLIALVGVAFIILSDEKIDFSLGSNDLSQEVDYYALGGYILAFAGGYMVALVAASQATYSEYFEELNSDLSSTMISQFFGRSLSVLFAFLLYWFIYPEVPAFSVHWPSTIYIGLIVFVVGGILYTYSLLKSDNPTIHILYYFVPVGAVIWLWLAGQAEITLSLFIGGTIVILANIYLIYVDKQKAKLSLK